MSFQLKKSLAVLNGFAHDFAAGIWLAAMVTVAMLHRLHLRQSDATALLNPMEHTFFWASVASMVVIMATGAGRTFTYVDNWYGDDAEKVRRRMLIVKHAVLGIAFGAGYLVVWPMVFHP